MTKRKRYVHYPLRPSLPYPHPRPHLAIHRASRERQDKSRGGKVSLRGSSLPLLCCTSQVNRTHREKIVREAAMQKTTKTTRSSALSPSARLPYATSLSSDKAVV